MELTFAKCVRISEVVRPSHLNKVTRFALAFLVFLGVSVQCWSAAHCPQAACAEIGVATRPIDDDPDCKCSDNDQGAHKSQSSHHNDKAACCCSLGKADVNVASSMPTLELPLQFHFAILPQQVVLLLPTEHQIAPHIPFYGDSSPPLNVCNPYLGRAPPVA